MLFTPTPEQADIIAATRTGQNVTISAGAGTGKTATLQFLAADRPQLKGLYVAFNRAIKDEARRKFAGSAIEARTLHSLAYATHGASMRDRLNGPKWMPPGQKAKILGIEMPITVRLDERAEQPTKQLGKTTLVRLVDDMLKRFMQSDAQTFDDIEIPVTGGLVFVQSAFRDELTATIRDYARVAWDDLNDPRGRLPYSHDAYFKSWSLDEESSRLPYDIIMLDEGQDASPVMIGVLRRQQTQIVVVGDTAQAIYGWRGAVDAMGQFGGVRLPLQQSFRFGPDIAQRANWWLEAMGAELRIRGLIGKPGQLGVVRTPDAVLCRSNGGVLLEVMEAQQRGLDVHIAGRHQAQALKNLAQACCELRTKGHTNHPDLDTFTSWDAVVALAERGDAPELEVLVKLVEKFEPEEIIRAIDVCVDVPSEAELTVSTMHVSKGLEWERVRIGEDFRKPKKDSCGEEASPIPAEEARLAYVAITRARTELDDTALSWCYRWPGGVQQAAASSPATHNRIMRDAPTARASAPVDLATFDATGAAAQVVILETLGKLFMEPARTARAEVAAAALARVRQVDEEAFGDEPGSKKAYAEALKEAGRTTTPLGDLVYTPGAPVSVTIELAEEELLAWAMKHRPELVEVAPRLVDGAAEAVRAALRVDGDRVVDADGQPVTYATVGKKPGTSERLSFAASNKKKAGEQAIRAWVERNAPNFVDDLLAITAAASEGDGQEDRSA